MKVKIEMDLTPQEAQELFVPGDRQTEFMSKSYDAYMQAMTQLVSKNIDPYGVTGLTKKNDDR